MVTINLKTAKREDFIKKMEEFHYKTEQMDQLLAKFDAGYTEEWDDAHLEMVKVYEITLVDQS